MQFSSKENNNTNTNTNNNNNNNNDNDNNNNNFKKKINEKKTLHDVSTTSCQEIFLKLKYPEKLIDLTISSFQHPPDVGHVSLTPSDSPLQSLCHSRIRNLLTWFADNFATSGLGERAVTICSQFSLAKRSLTT